MFSSLLRFIELRGLQAAGKTTLTREWQSKYPNVARVNRDDLRGMLFGENYKLRHEPVVLACEIACANACVVSGYHTVIDDTNLTGSTLWKDLAEKIGIKHDVHELKVSVKEAIERDAKRPNPVGPVAIRATAARAKNVQE